MEGKEGKFSEDEARLALDEGWQQWQQWQQWRT